jgi:tetratricopeptide (TPR) repeat protein
VALACLTVAWSQPNDAGRLLDSATLYLVNQQYARADITVKRVLRFDPGNAKAVYLAVASAQTKILDYESYEIDADAFVENARMALENLDKSLQARRGQDSLLCVFYMGNIQGGISVMHAKLGNWPAAVESGAASIGAFKRIIKIAPSFYPAYLGLGIFNYYIGQNLTWLPFFQDKRTEGIEQIRLSTKAGFPYSYVAKNSLCWILIDRDDYVAADSIASAVLADLPSNTMFIRLKARIALLQKDIPQATSWAKKLVGISEKRVPVNWSDLVSGYQILVSASDDIDSKNECLGYCRRILAKHIPELYTKIPYIKKHLHYIADIQRKYGG